MNLDKLFHLKENHTDVKTEVMAGITTFMTKSTAQNEHLFCYLCFYQFCPFTPSCFRYFC